MPARALPRRQAETTPARARVSFVLLLAAAIGALASPASSAPADSSAAAFPDSADTASAAFAAPIAAATPEAAPAPPVAGEPVYLGGRVLVQVRDLRGLESLRKRAVAIRKRLSAVVRDRTIDPATVQAVAADSVAVVLVGDFSMFTVTPQDLAAGDRRTPLEAARALLPELREGIRRERSQLAPLRLVTSIGLSLAFLLATILGARLALRLWRRSAPKLRARFAAVVPGIRVRGFEVLSAERAVRLGERATGVCLAAAGLLAAYLVLSVVFSFFPWTQGWSHRLLAFASGSALAAAAAVGGALPGLVLAAAVLYLFQLLIRFASGILDRAAMGWITIPGLHRELARPTKQLLRLGLWVVAVIIVYPLIPGSQSVAFRGVSIVLGVMVSLGSVGLVDNLLAGLILTYARSYRIGERIRAGELEGDVVALGLLTTKLRTIKNEEVTIGNSQVLRGSVLNYSRRAAEGEGLILHTSVTIGYDAPWRKVHELLTEAARVTEGIESEPAPFVLQRSLDDFFVTYEINAYTKQPTEMARLYALLHQNIQDAFNRGGIEIMSPHYTSLRDGNTVTIPEADRRPGYRPGAFRVEPREPKP
ncbi:MAG TPA: mechanosensitive ion channel family protein [Candidatus Eisenbacteria bacterium]|jgi:small-conductance mechanosensitive channel